MSDISKRNANLCWKCQSLLGASPQNTGAEATEETHKDGALDWTNQGI
jgi:hypothetical protein